MTTHPIYVTASAYHIVESLSQGLDMPVPGALKRYQSSFREVNIMAVIRNRVKEWIVLVCLAAFALAHPAKAQVLYGSIVGTVQDESGEIGRAHV